MHLCCAFYFCPQRRLIPITHLVKESKVLTLFHTGVYFSTLPRLNVPMVQYRQLIPTLNAWAVREKYTPARPIATHFSGHACDHRSLTSQLKAALIRKLSGSLMCLAYFIDMLSVGICTTRH